MLPGAHVPISLGVEKSPLIAHELELESFAIYLNTARGYSAIGSSFTEQQQREFAEACEVCDFDPSTDILVHGALLINLANPLKGFNSVRDKSIRLMETEIKKCAQLGIRLYNFHPGSTVKKCSRDEGIKLIGEGINQVHKSTSDTDVITVIECMAGQGSVLGGDLKDLRDIINLVKDKTRVGVCIDTCHAFAYGYNLSQHEMYIQFWKDFDEIVGYKYLKGMHINDSQHPLNSKKDRHAPLGEGCIGKKCFEMIMRDITLEGIPLILETPPENYRKEIAMLKGWM